MKKTKPPQLPIEGNHVCTECMQQPKTTHSKVCMMGCMARTGSGWLECRMMEMLGA